MKTKRKCFLYICKVGFLMGVKLLHKICVTLKYDYERTYHKSLTLKILFYPTKFLESRSFPGAFPLELPWIHWGPQDPLPTIDTPSNFKSWIFPGVLS